MQMSKLWLGVVSLFPEMFNALGEGIPGRVISSELVTLDVFNPRDFTKDARKTVDDRPFGGGPGMVMTPEPLVKAIAAAKEKAPKDSKVIFLSPKGKRYSQATAVNAAASEGLIFVAGRYEGIDQRVIDAHIDEEWSLGDFVLTGGELAAMAMIDSIIRLLPGSLGDDESALYDSFMQKGWLDHPHYTRPVEFEGRKVPAVLLSGNHSEIERWRKKKALGQTFLKRPDLVDLNTLTSEEHDLLNEFKKELGETS